MSFAVGRGGYVVYGANLPPNWPRYATVRSIISAMVAWSSGLPGRVAWLIGRCSRRLQSWFLNYLRAEPVSLSSNTIMSSIYLGGLPLILTLVLMFVAVALWLRGREMRFQSGLPDGDIIYTDSGAWRANQIPLYASRLKLAGKPDYLVEQEDGMIVPVELKSSLAPDTPWEGQILQLAAYCLLVEENYGVRPAYGILQYKDRAFAIDYTDDLEADLLDLLAEMRATRDELDPAPDVSSNRQCRTCGVRDTCDRRRA